MILVVMLVVLLLVLVVVFLLLVLLLALPARVLCNKPVRPAMVSTLQQRWAATGGMPPQ